MILRVDEILVFATPNPEKVALFVDLLRRDLPVPPIVVWRNEGRWQLLDGCHRHAAALAENNRVRGVAAMSTRSKS